MSEQWRPIPGFEGLYEVSDLGRVRTLPRWHVPQVRVHQANPDAAGYTPVRLRKDGRVHNHRVHELVLLAFVGPRPDDQDIRHLDGNPANNALLNLAYGTRSENMRDTLRHGTHGQASKTHCPRGHPYDAANMYRIPSRPRSRYCRTCQAASKNRRRANQRALGLRVT